MSFTTIEAAHKYDTAYITRKFNEKKYRQVGRALSAEEGLRIARRWRLFKYQAKCLETSDSYHTQFGKRRVWLIWAWKKESRRQ